MLWMWRVMSSFVLLLIVVALVWMSSKQDRIDQQNQQILAQVEGVDAAKNVVRAYLTQEHYNTDVVLCDQGGVICPLVTTVPSDNTQIGPRDPLWVTLDAVNVLAKRMPGEKSGELRRYLMDFAAATSEYGAFELAMDKDFGVNVYTTDLYFAVLAHAMVCHKNVAGVACTGGLPEPVAKALKTLAEFVQREGPAVAAYEMNFRMPAVDVVAKAL